MSKEIIHSNRKYKVAICDADGIALEKVSIRQLLSTDTGNNWEFIYSMQDIIDKVLDLKEGESITFQPNRDDPNSKGIIYRLF